ncbi:hypothetical protein KC356_g211 [Hortaea werneckii]|nr:hypothetical protein KC356_g211 [Hortaea werneckii]
MRVVRSFSSRGGGTWSLYSQPTKWRKGMSSSSGRPKVGFCRLPLLVGVLVQKTLRKKGERWQRSFSWRAQIQDEEAVSRLGWLGQKTLSYSTRDSSTRDIQDTISHESRLHPTDHLSVHLPPSYRSTTLPSTDPSTVELTLTGLLRRYTPLSKSPLPFQLSSSNEDVARPPPHPPSFIASCSLNDNLEWPHPLLSALDTISKSGIACYAGSSNAPQRRTIYCIPHLLLVISSLTSSHHVHSRVCSPTPNFAFHHPHFPPQPSSQNHVAPPNPPPSRQHPDPSPSPPPPTYGTSSATSSPYSPSSTSPDQP